MPEAGLYVGVAPALDVQVRYGAPGGFEIELTGESHVIEGATWWEVVGGHRVPGRFVTFG